MNMTETTETKAETADAPAGWRIGVSRACISSGICLTAAPGHFEFVGVRARPTTDLIHSAEEAEHVMDVGDGCPVGAITVVEVGVDD